MTAEKQKCRNTGVENGGMAGAFSVMGLNHNLEFMGRQLHVQTENTGFPVTRIVTQVFCKGRVVFSKKSECPPDLHESRDPRKIHERMRTQHFQVIREIQAKQAGIPAHTTSGSTTP
jgi:hypothetical protein